MRFLRIAACLLVLIFSLATLGWGADISYSGIPGKFSRKPKGSKGVAPETPAQPQNPGSKKIIDDGKLQVTVGPKRG